MKRLVLGGLLGLAAACGGTSDSTTGTTDGGSGSAGTAGSGTGGTSGSAGAAGTGTGGSAGSAGSAGTAGTGGVAGSAGSGGTTGCGFCDWECCGDVCVNTGNDIKNCSACGTECPGESPYCDHGTCGTPPCEGIACVGTKQCCGTQCCDAGQLCCSIPGPIGESIQCVEPNELGTCPPGCNSCICNGAGTPIATPDGERAIEDLREGDIVYSVDHAAVVAVPILVATRTPAPNHVVVRLELANGAVLEVSPSHPTADGRTFLDLVPGATLDGIAVVRRTFTAYRHPFTYDILPDSDTGTYFAGGARIASTLARPATGSRRER